MSAKEEWATASKGQTSDPNAGDPTLPAESVSLDDYMMRSGLAGSELIEQLARIRSLTLHQAVHGFCSDQIVLSINSELGEVCEAIASEDGHKDRKVDETSVVECIDLISCAISLYFARGGKLSDFTSTLRRKMDKWEKKLNDRYSKAPPS